MVWEPYFPTVMQIEKQLQTIAEPRFVEPAHQVVKRVQSLLNAGSHPFSRVEIERSDEWQTLCRKEYRPGCDDALFWLGELLGQM